MKRLCIVTIAFLLAGAAEAADPFWTYLTPEERAAAGLAELTPAQKAALDQLAERFARDRTQHAVAQVQAEVKQQKVAKAGLEAAEADEAIRTRLVGEFRGWNGRTSFRLENDQIWQQTDSSEKFWTTPLTNVDVELRPSSFGGWKLWVLPVARWVRVKRIH